MTDESGQATTHTGCCVPARPGPLDKAAGPEVPVRGREEARSDGLARQFERVTLPGGSFSMGTEDREGFPSDGEGPVREVTIRTFAIDTTAVTNRRFGEFVDATGYITEATRWGWSYVFAGFLPADLRKVSGRPPGTPWWCAVDGADWSHPEGPGSDLADRADHPVVHISWADGAAFADWAGGRLPTEAEWEYAARGGLDGARYPWGDELTPDGEHRCNIWQGAFPTRNTGDDGFRGTAPVRSYPANGFGLYEVAGNVWEWTADWWHHQHSADSVRDPHGPPGGTARVIRGGSYLCHASYCNRYRVAARSRNDPDTSSGNQGFRCVYDITESPAQ